MDILDLYAMAGGIAQIFSGVVFYVRFMHKKVSLWFYLLSVVCGGIFVHVIRGSVTVQMAAYVLLLTICGMLLPKEGDRAERPRIKKAADFQQCHLDKDDTKNSVCRNMYPVLFLYNFINHLTG